MEHSELFRTEKISKVLLRLAPPVMLAQLIQALYNIVDSLFVGRYSESGLTALSIIYPIQLLMIALAVGTGVGINTVMAAKLGVGEAKKADEYASVGTPLAAALWLLFAAVCWAVMPAYARISTSSDTVIRDVTVYGRIVCVFSFGLFLESIWTKVLQSIGDMKTPMIAQILGAVTNIVLDPLLIFGLFGLPEMGIAGAAVATVAGQIVAALVVMRKGFRRSPAAKTYPHHVAKIFRLGIPNILMQSAYTFYIFGVPLGYLFSRFGLSRFWLTYPVTEILTSIVGFVFYRQFLKKDYVSEPKPLRADDGDAVALKPSKPGVIITIAREHGSSGKQIGKLVAQKLGIPFYYKEIVALAAHESGLDREFISDIHKNAPDAMRDLYLSSQVVQRAIAAQDRIIRRIADNGSCVIVGRAADYVLREHNNVVRVFVHAPLDYRIRRVMEIYGDTLREAKRNIRRAAAGEK